MALPKTYLFVPAERPDRFSKALASGADRIIIDLEDAVRPAAKEEARAVVAGADIDWSRTVIRINDATTPFWDGDLELLGRVSAQAVLVPKAESARELAEVRRAAANDIEVIPQIETGRALADLGPILAAEGLQRLAFGHIDFAADLGCSTDWDSLLLARSMLVLQSRAAGKHAPLDSVTQDIGSDETLEQEARGARKLGFSGKLLIHPRQIDLVKRVFSPSKDEVAWARRVVDADATTSAGAAMVDGKLIDKPVVEVARRVLREAGLDG